MAKRFGSKRGWIRIVEAFVAILLITGVTLIILNRGYILKKDISEKVYDVELAILREIQMDTELRKEIGNIDDLEIPVEWAEFNNLAPLVKAKIISRTPNYLNCIGKICSMDDMCNLITLPVQNKDIYAQSITITVTAGQTSGEKYRQLKLFCWTK